MSIPNIFNTPVRLVLGSQGAHVRSAAINKLGAKIKALMQEAALIPAPPSKQGARTGDAPYVRQLHRGNLALRIAHVRGQLLTSAEAIENNFDSYRTADRKLAALKEHLTTTTGALEHLGMPSSDAIQQRLYFLSKKEPSYRTNGGLNHLAELANEEAARTIHRDHHRLTTAAGAPAQASNLTHRQSQPGLSRATAMPDMASQRRWHSTPQLY